MRVSVGIKGADYIPDKPLCTLPTHKAVPRSLFWRKEEENMSIVSVMRLAALSALMAVLGLAAMPFAQAEGGWRWGRATFYGIYWSIHQ